MLAPILLLSTYLIREDTFMRQTFRVEMLPSFIFLFILDYLIDTLNFDEFITLLTRSCSEIHCIGPHPLI